MPFLPILSIAFNRWAWALKARICALVSRTIQSEFRPVRPECETSLCDAKHRRLRDFGAIVLMTTLPETTVCPRRYEKA